MKYDDFDSFLQENDWLEWYPIHIFRNNFSIGTHFFKELIVQYSFIAPSPSPHLTSKLIGASAHLVHLSF